MIKEVMLKYCIKTTNREDLIADLTQNAQRENTDLVDANKAVDRFSNVKRRKLNFIIQANK